MKYLGALLGAACLTAAAHADIKGVAFGTGSPPSTVADFCMRPFPSDGIGGYTEISSLASPLGGSISFSPNVLATDIGSGWASWSHGYTGDVYWTNGATKLTMRLPKNTGAFYFYAEPNPFAVYTITAVGSDGSKSVTVSQDVDGSGGACGYGFWASCDSTIASVTVESSVDFAVGEFGIELKTGVGVTAFGTKAPPSSLHCSDMSDFGSDGYSDFDSVSKVATPIGSSVGFSPSVEARSVPGSWATWSHSYTGRVYYSGGATKVTMTMPTQTGAFIFYAEPNPFAVYKITATGSDGSVTTASSQDVDGSAGACGWGFYSRGHSDLVSVVVESSVDFAIGEFSIAAKRGLGGRALGTGAPPARLGGFDMTAYDNIDPRAQGADYSSFPSPISSKAVTSDIGLNHRSIGSGWATWSHGYTGSVYYTNGATTTKLTMPAQTTGFYLYAEPNPFAVYTITATGSDGRSSVAVSQDVDGSAGAKGFGFFGHLGQTITSITVQSSVDFAIGEFGIAASCNCLADCDLNGVLNVNDFICFQSQWQQKTVYGDFNNDGKWNVNDFITFQAAFASKKGCP